MKSSAGMAVGTVTDRLPTGTFWLKPNGLVARGRLLK